MRTYDPTLWFDTRQAMVAALVPTGARLAEVGVFEGVFAAELLRLAQPRELHLIDRWQGQVTCLNQHNQDMRTRDTAQCYHELVSRYRADARVTLHRCDSVEALIRFPRDYFDFVYIDADHSYQGCLRDLQAAARVSTAIGGHDYAPALWPGVVQAVDEVIAAGGWALTALTRDAIPSFHLRRVTR